VRVNFLFAPLGNAILNHHTVAMSRPLPAEFQSV
jgi:hypothetical protein